MDDDESAGPFPIGFDFNWYNTTFSEFYIHSNGLISFGSFGSGFDEPPNQCDLSDIESPNDEKAASGLIALMWDDLDPGDTGDLVYYESFATCPIGSQEPCLIVQYDNFHHFPGGANNIAGTFEAILFESGDILLQYADVGDEQGANAITGLKNRLGTTGLTGHDARQGHLFNKLAPLDTALNSRAGILSSPSPTVGRGGWGVRAGRNADQITEQNTPLSWTQGIHQIEPNGRSVVATIGSGHYHFTMPYTPMASHPSPPPNTAHREPRLSACVAIGDLLNDKAAMSLLKKHLPLSQPMVAEALKVSATMSLYQITEWAPHIISLELAQTIDAELRQI